MAESDPPTPSGPECGLFERALAPEGALRGCVVLVHGYAEHCGRYAHIASALTDAGFGCLLYDQRGFGQSPGRPAYIDDIRGLVEDLACVVERARARWPDVPLFLFGHSMGGLVATLYCMSADLTPKGLVLSSPLLSTPESPFLQRISGILGAVVPRLPTIRLNRDLLSHDPAIARIANQDPLNYHGRLPARTGAELLRGMRVVRRSGHRLDLPMLLLHGTEDRLTDPEATSALYARASSSQKQLSLYEGLYHETFNEPSSARVLEDIVEWMEEYALG